MKKVIAIVALFVVALSTSSSAQTSATPFTSNVISISFMYMPIYMKYGDITGDVTESTVQVPDGRGTIKFNKRAGKYVEAVFTNAAGESTKLSAVTAFTGSAPKPNCSSRETTGLFASSDGSMHLSICKTAPLADGSMPLIVSLVLPAVQSAREAAPRNN